MFFIKNIPFLKISFPIVLFKPWFEEILKQLPHLKWVSGVVQNQKPYFTELLLKGWFGQFSDVSNGQVPQTPINISTPDTIPVIGDDGERRWTEVAKNQVLRNLNSAIMKARAKSALKFPRSAWDDDHFDPTAFLN